MLIGNNIVEQGGNGLDEDERIEAVMQHQRTNSHGVY
jgi:hypothetical protein